jgi:threonine aldolase
VTKPDKAMMKAMMTAPLGDDMYRSDPTNLKLQEEVAKLYGKEQGILVPSGTMANLMALMLHCKKKGDAAILGHMSHILNYERGGMSQFGGVHPLVVPNFPDATFDMKEVDFVIRTRNEHFSEPKVICLESSHNLCNGRVPSMDFIKQV